MLKRKIQKIIKTHKFFCCAKFFKPAEEKLTVEYIMTAHILHRVPHSFHATSAGIKLFLTHHI